MIRPLRNFGNVHMEGAMRPIILMAAVATTIAATEFASAQNVQGVCVSGCYIPPPPGPPSSQPSPADLDARDVREAADDAQDRGVAAYRRGDYAAAVRYFTEAHNYAPDDPDIAQNLTRARAQFEAQNQARAAPHVGGQLSGQATRQSVAVSGAEQAPQIYDGRRGARDRGGISVPVGPSTGVPGSSARDPVVPDARRTPAIANLERDRASQRARIAAINGELETLNPNMHAARIARRRQEQSQAESQIGFINFSINEALQAPSAVPTPQRP